MNDKTIVMSDAINSGENFLAHYGIKGQQWGQRRFQNEDGTLTEEGRRRYGLNPKYANMTDKEMRDALERKRTQNEYIQNVTAEARKKQQDIRGFTAEALNVAGQGVNLWDKTKLESDRKAAQTNIDKYTEAKKEYIEKMNDIKDDLGKKAVKKDPTYLGYKSEAEKYENMIKEQKGLKDEGIKAKKDLANLAVNTGKSYAPDLISKGATAREIKEKTAEAQRNIEEMDHEQLKKVVDRMRLEKQYDELMNPPKPSKVERGREVLQTIGALMGVALTALSIAEVVKKLGKKGDVAHTDLVEAGEEFLAHYRTKGSKNGVRRYQNEDGSLTPEGYRHYGIDPNGRQAADPREILARQRAQEKADAKQAKVERRQARYTQKFAERQALRDAKNNARIQNVYNRQALQAQRMQARQDLEDQRSQEAFRQEQNRFDAKMKAENRANIRKNVIKGVAAVAVIGAALYTGRHFLQQRALDNQHVRDIEKIKLNHKNDIERIRTETEPIMYDNETKRMMAKNEHQEKMKGTYEQHTKRYEDETSRKENKALRENKDLGEKVKNLSRDKNDLEKQTKSLKNELDITESQRKVLADKTAEKSKKLEDLTKENESLKSREKSLEGLTKENEYLKGKVEAHDADQKRRDEANRKRNETRARNAKINEKEIKKLAKNGKFVLSGLFSGSVKQLKKGG